MTEFRSIGARPDSTRGTAAVEVRKGLAGLFTNPGVLPGSASPLVQGTSAFSYQVNAGTWVTSRGAGDGYHLWGNDGPRQVPTDPAPASGLSRIDVVYALHPSASENGDTSSQPVLAVAKGTPASLPVAPTIPVGALELARNTMTSAATNTVGGGNSIAQTAPVADVVRRAPTLHLPDSGYPTSTTTTSTPRLHNRITIPAAPFARLIQVTGVAHLTYSQNGQIEVMLYLGSTLLQHHRVTVTQDALTPFALSGQATLGAGVAGVVEVLFNRVTGPGIVTPSVSSLSILRATAAPA